MPVKSDLTSEREDQQSARHRTPRHRSLVRIPPLAPPVEREEHREAYTVWDFVQGISAYARRIPFQDDRIAIEQKAASIMRKGLRT